MAIAVPWIQLFSPPAGSLSLLQITPLYWGDGDSSKTFAPSANLTPESTLLLFIDAFQGGTITGVSDDVNGAWTLVDNITTVYCYKWINNASSAKPTVTITGTSLEFTRMPSAFYEIGGANTTDSVDAHNTSTNGFGIDLHCGSITTSTTTFIIGALLAAPSDRTITPDAGYTLVNNIDVPVLAGTIYQNAVPAGTYNPGGTYDIDAQGFDALCVAIKA